MSDLEPIAFRPRLAATALPAPQRSAAVSPVPFAGFDGHELRQILSLYGRKVAAGEWRDYAIDFGREKAVFSVFRRNSEHALYRIEKTPKLSRRQGAYSVVAATGLVLRRGHDLRRVLEVLEKTVRLVHS